MKYSCNGLEVPWNKLCSCYCSASTALAPSTSTDLASYHLQLPTVSSVTRAGSRWFEAAVQHIAKLAGSTAFLQTVYHHPKLRFSHTQLSDSDITSGWAAIAQEVGAAAADCVLLVHPMKSAADACLLNQHGAGECPACSEDSMDMFAQSRQVAETLSGHFGDCCDGNSSAHESSPSSSHQDAAAHALDSSTAFYGVVVQSKHDKHLQGCYLLKTVRVKHRSSHSTGCHCTHYSLTRICKGPTLQQQFKSSWLTSN